MKILIVGTGGVGGFYGGLLAKNGNDVTFVARGNHYRQIKECGLQIKSVAGDFLVKSAQVVSSGSKAENPDLILFCVKTYDTEAVLKSVASIVKPNTVIISLQNGIDNAEIIERKLKECIVVSGLTYIISAKTAPGLIEQTAGIPTIIFGRHDHQHNDLLNKIEKIMLAANIDATHSEEIEKELWLKFARIIAFAGMTSLFRSSISPIISDPERLSLYTRCREEVFSVARTLKINITEAEYKNVIQKSEKYNMDNPSSKSSMLIDIENNRQTEIESLHGKLCKLAKEVGVAVPINEVIYNVIRFYNINNKASAHHQK